MAHLSCVQVSIGATVQLPQWKFEHEINETLKHNVCGNSD